VIRVERHGRVLVATIDRPQRRNAVDHTTLLTLHEVLVTAAAAAAEGEIGALLLHGAGGVFCAGADLNGVEDHGFTEALRSELSGLGQLAVATIAAIEGPALGAGSQLAVACDLRVATPDARFGIPAARLGLAVDQWTVQRVSLLAGQGAARAMLLAAEVLSGLEAHRLGLVQRIGTPADALAWGEAIAALAPLTIAAHKLALEHLVPPLPHDGEVLAAIERAWASADAQEGRTAFLDKRPARFTGT